MPTTQDSWLPIRAALRPEGLYLALRQIAALELRDAFMQETVGRLPAPETIVHLPRAELDRQPLQRPPAGLLFHVARCGSTLVSQMLKRCDDVVVYAEPLPVNEILLPPHAWPRADLVAALRAVGSALARHAGRPYVLKFSSWNTLYCDLLTEAFPQSPWALCLRDPAEVAVSLLKDTPGWLKDTEEPARRLAGVIDPAGHSRSREEYYARVYAAFCDAAAQLDPPQGKLLLYETLPSAVWEVLAPHFSLTLDERQRREMVQVARQYSKAPVGQPKEFAPDAATKQAAVSATLRQAIAALALPALQRLTART
jgi:hypothetical protein